MGGKLRQLAEGGMLPPKWWNESDGCSRVPDHHYRKCCENHDWQYRHARFPVWMDDRDAQLYADRLLRRCMRRANGVRMREARRRGFFGGLLGLGGQLVRWWWRPHAWFVTLRFVGDRAWTPLSERHDAQQTPLSRNRADEE